MTDPWKRRVEIGGTISDVSFLGFDGNVFVYVYAIEADGVTVYVGSTSQPIRDRIRSHVADAMRASPLPIHEWMRSRRFIFSVRLLEVVKESARVAAEQKWMRSFSAELLNVTDGGPGMSGHRFAGTDHARRIGEAQKSGGDFPCLTCGKTFWRKRREVLLGHNKFCSKPCYQLWQRGKPKHKLAAL